MAHKINNRFAFTKDGEMLERTFRNGRVVWVWSENPTVAAAAGRNATDADYNLLNSMAARHLDIKIGPRGAHKLAIA